MEHRYVASWSAVVLGNSTTFGGSLRFTENAIRKPVWRVRQGTVGHARRITPPAGEDTPSGPEPARQK
ncbi:hypothetical protein [Streptomyces sp. NPDC006285]|uniref:hypothetical protein n=1 Tax=Streptomyces sp. NPDC006285 TaxID=3364742 RepID=UPI0036872B57